MGKQPMSPGLWRHHDSNKKRCMGDQNLWRYMSLCACYLKLFIFSYSKYAMHFMSYCFSPNDSNLTSRLVTWKGTLDLSWLPCKCYGQNSKYWMLPMEMAQVGIMVLSYYITLSLSKNSQLEHNFVANVVSLNH